MRCTLVEKLLADCEEGSTPKPVEEHLAGCAACRAYRERLHDLRLLLSLKQHETPEPGVEARCLAGIHRRIAAPKSRSWRARLGDIFEMLTLEPVPALRYSVAAMLVLLVSIHIMSMPQLPTLEGEALGVDPVVEEAAAPAAPTAAITESAPVFPGLRTASATNPGPAQIEYGTLPSTLVDFEY